MFNLALWQALEGLQSVGELLGTLSFQGEPTADEGRTIQKLLRAQRLLLYDLAEYLETCRGIVTGFVPADRNPARHPVVKAYDRDVEWYSSRVRHLANRVKHQQGRLRSLVLQADGAYIPGYFLETGYDRAMAGPDPVAHEGGHYAISFVRDLRLHLVQVFLIADAVEEGIGALLSDLPAVVLLEQVWTERAILAVAKLAALLPDLSFPDEIEEPFPVVDLSVTSDGRPELGLAWGIPRWHSATHWSFQATTISGGDGRISAYKLPYIGGEQEERLARIYDRVLQTYRCCPDLFRSEPPPLDPRLFPDAPPADGRESGRGEPATRKTDASAAAANGTPGRLLLLRFTLLGFAEAGPGLAFHRWYPRGPRDWIELPTEAQDSRLFVWVMVNPRTFPRELVGNNDDIPKQGVVAGGILQGCLWLCDQPPEAIRALEANDYGHKPWPAPSAEYERLGKRAVKLIHGAISRMLEVLRGRFGQHWLPHPPPWDSRRGSLGAYCRGHLGMEWTVDPVAGWRPFQPTANEYYDPGGHLPYPLYLTRSDWERIPSLLAAGYSVVPLLVSRAHRAATQGDWRLALLEAGMALESALTRSAFGGLSGHQRLEDAAGAFHGLGIPQRIAIVAALAPGVPNALAESAIDGVGLRNKVVHEGWTPSQPPADQVYAMLDLAAHVESGVTYKLPPPPGDRNLMQGASAWDDWEAKNLTGLWRLHWAKRA